MREQFNLTLFQAVSSEVEILHFEGKVIGRFTKYYPI